MFSFLFQVSEAPFPTPILLLTRYWW
jgi:hypothetical protein